MTTITIETEEALTKTKFRNIAELRHFLLQGDAVDLVAVDDSDCPSDVVDLVKTSKVLPKEAFINI